jgi:hypothetical protein
VIIDISLHQGSDRMNMLYDSESFVVVHIQADAQPVFDSGEKPAPTVVVDALRPVLARNGFEIVDKRTGKEIYLDGSWAELFQKQIDAWQEKTPTQEEVEDALERYTALAQNPVVLH